MRYYVTVRCSEVLYEVSVRCSVMYSVKCSVRCSEVLFEVS